MDTIKYLFELSKHVIMHFQTGYNLNDKHVTWIISVCMLEIITRHWEGRKENQDVIILRVVRKNQKVNYLLHSPVPIGVFTCIYPDAFSTSRTTVSSWLVSFFITTLNFRGALRSWAMRCS